MPILLAYVDDSIQCAKAHLPDEKAICRSVELQKLDIKMTTLFEVSGHLMAMDSRRSTSRIKGWKRFTE